MKYPLVCIVSFAFLFSCILTPLPTREKIRPAGYGSVVPAGDLRSRIDKSMAALTADIGNPRSLFEEDSTGKVAARVGDALLGIVLLSSSTGEDDGLAKKIYDLIPPALNETGYMGEILRGEAIEAQIAGHGRLIRALCEYYRWKGDTGALDMAQTICDSLYVPMLAILEDYPGPEIPRVNVYFAAADSLDSEDGNTIPEPETSPQPVKIGNWTVCEKYGEIFASIDALAILYGYNKNDNTAKVIDRLIDMYNSVRDEFPGKGTAGYLSAIRGMLRYDSAQGRSRFEQDARQAWEQFTGTSLTDMYGSGRTTPEGFGIVCPEDASEAFMAAVCLWVESGKGDYLQQAERIYYNSVAPAQRADGRFTCLLSDTLDGRISRYTGEAYGGTVAWVEALPFAVEHSYFLRDNKVLIPMYGESELVLEGRGVRITQKSGYPLDSAIIIEIVEAPKRGVGLQLYFPSYMSSTGLLRNGAERVSGTVNNIGLLGMDEIYRKGDVLRFGYEFGPKWTEASSDGQSDGDLYKAVYGPLLLGYRYTEMLWLQRGVPLRRGGRDGFIFNPEFDFTLDTLSGKVMVHEVPDGIPFTPPSLDPIYEPINSYLKEDILPEYFLIRIGKE